MDTMLSLRWVRRAITTSSFLFLVSLHGRAQVSPQFEALSGQQVPGLPAGFRWNSFDGAAIGHDGEIYFIAHLTNPQNGSGGSGIWRGEAGNFSAVVREGDLAPDAGVSAEFQSFYPPATRSSDSTRKPLAFRAQVNVGGSSKNGIYSVPDVRLPLLSKVMMEGDAAPGGGTFDSLTTIYPVVAASDGSLAFVASVNGQASIFDNFTGSVVRRARAFDDVPGLSKGVFTFNGQVALTMGDVGPQTGVLAFASTISNGPAAPDGQIIASGIFDNPNGPAEARFFESQATETAGIKFTSLGPPNLVVGGNIAFSSGVYGTGIDLTNNEAVFLGDEFVAQKKDAAPESATAETFFHFSRTVVANASEVLFGATLLEPFTNNQRTGLCIGNRIGFPTKVAYEGDHAPGTPDDVEFGPLSDFGFMKPQFNSHGQVAFRATVTGPSVGNNNIGIWGSLPDGELVLVARKGDKITVAPGDERTVISLGFLNGGVAAGPADGNPRALNDSGRVVFTVDFSDDSSGIGRASLGTPAADSDGDGINDGDEAAAGTNHLDPSSRFVIVSVDLVVGDAVEIRLSTVVGRRYTLQSSTDMVTWTNEDEAASVNVPGTGAQIVFRDVNPVPGVKFYRVLVGP